MKRVAIVGVGVVVALLIVAQLVLPGIAERRVRDELEQLGAVSNVEVSSFPAVKLLFGEIDSLEAGLTGSQASDGEVADLLAKAENIDRLRIAADRVQVSGLGLTGARLSKDGERLEARATLSQADLVSFLPPGTEVRSISSEGGRLLLDGSFSAFGVQVSGPASVAPQGGAIVLSPEGIPLGGLAALTIFSDERVQVERLDATAEGDRLRLSAGGRLVGG